MAKTVTEITATAIYRVIGQPCWGVPSDDTSRTLPYKVCFDEASCNWTCECAHGQFRADKGLSANCKHVRAVFVSITANKETQDRDSKRAAFEAKVAEEEKAQTEDYARYRAEKERRDTQAYEKRLAERGSLRREVRMESGIPMR